MLHFSASAAADDDAMHKNAKYLQHRKQSRDGRENRDKINPS